MESTPASLSASLPVFPNCGNVACCLAGVLLVIVGTLVSVVAVSLTSWVPVGWDTGVSGCGVSGVGAGAPPDQVNPNDESTAKWGSG